MQDPFDKLEPEARSVRGPADIIAQVSIAISLKRIADALTECDQYGQTGSAAIACAVRDGIREGS